ncbi:MAG: DUF2752 domain-containing protein, partial [Oscillospiraceae bacterium]|nr:DUF2752 domain-containing protein [Oscillospiraceae bacterium]
MNNKKYLNDKKPASLLPICAILGILGFRIVQIYKFGIPCRFWQFTGIYCPGCGGTRAFLALLDGNLRLSVHENPAVLLLMIFGILYSLEKILKFRN